MNKKYPDLSELQELYDSVEYWLDNEPNTIRVREGGGLENIAQSFAVTIMKIRSKS